MVSNSRKQAGQNSSDNVFDHIPVGPGEAALVASYLDDQDYAANSRRALLQDFRKFAAWFAQANAEPFRVSRVTTRDVTDFKDALRRQRGQAVTTVNRCLVTLRRFFAWAAEKGHIQANPIGTKLRKLVFQESGEVLNSGEVSETKPGRRNFPVAIVTQVAELLQGLLHESMNALARDAGCVKRERKFSGSTLLSTLVLTVLRSPRPRLQDFQSTAAQLGVSVTENAIAQRFTPQLVEFLAAAIQRTLKHVLISEAPPIKLLDRFVAVVIGDSTTISLPDEFAAQFPGCGGSYGSGQAALKIQVLWDLRCGRLEILLEPGRASDAKSAILAQSLPAGSLSILDLGYFSLDRFERVGQDGSYWLSRLQHGTQVFHGSEKAVVLAKFLQEQARCGIVDVPVQLGEKRLPCRLVAVRVPPEVAARRRRKIREKARDHGREPSQEYLQIQEWTIFVTNCPASLLTWKEVVVLYRARWQIERLFKLWKSYNRLADRRPGASPEQQLAEIYAKIIAMIIQHGILLMAVWIDGRRSLWRAAAMIRDWIGPLIAVLTQRQSLRRMLERQRQCLARTARVNSRRKHPSCFQLLTNPELLEYIVA